MSLEPLLRKPLQALPPDASCQDAALLMRDQNIGCVVVIAADERPLGVVTDRDLVLEVMAKGRDAKRVQLSEVMSRDPIFVALDRDPSEVVKVMHECALRRIVVVDEGGRGIGLLALDDLLLLLAAQLGDLAGAVRAEIAGE